MNTIQRLTVCACGLAFLAGWPARAADPPRTTGHVLVLDNERTIEGDIEKVGDQYRVRRPIGETWVPGDKVLRLCTSREQAYAYLRTAANLRDPDERLRLAHWCQARGLRDQALAEVQAAVDLRPGHAESQRLLRNLQRSAAAAPAAPPRPAEEPEPDPSPPPQVDVPAEALGPFVTRVQPILMNTCAGCHAGNQGGAFKLTRTFETHRRATQQNLAAALARVSPANPLASPLLVKAVNAHGGADQPPLKSRQAAPYRALEEWVRLAVGGQPQTKDPALDAAMPPAAEPKTAFAGEPPVKAEAPVAAPRTSTGRPADPFDPAIFNRQMHPER